MFWSILAVVILALVALLVLPPRGSAPAAPTSPSPATAPSSVSPATPSPAAVATTAPAAAAAPALEPAQRLAAGADTAAPADAKSTVQSADAATTKAQPEPAVEISAAKPEVEPEVISATEAAGEASPTDMLTKMAAAAENASAVPMTLPEHPKFKGDLSVPAKVLRRADGGMLIDGRFLVTGAGTAAAPYVVPWEMIASAQETYKPRLGMLRIPQRVSFLDGKHVELEGFVAFPITAASPREALIMLNQWDGCCIGTPPTPYDAVEVKLSEPASAGQKVMTSGTMTGIFRVDPYEDGGWLLGLYLMEDAKLAGTPGV